METVCGCGFGEGEGEVPLVECFIMINNEEGRERVRFSHVDRCRPGGDSGFLLLGG